MWRGSISPATTFRPSDDVTWANFALAHWSGGRPPSRPFAPAMKQFLLRGASSPPKKLLRTRRTRRRVRLKHERAAALSRSPGVFDSLRGRSERGGRFACQNGTGWRARGKGRLRAPFTQDQRRVPPAQILPRRTYVLDKREHMCYNRAARAQRGERAWSA